MHKWTITNLFWTCVEGDVKAIYESAFKRYIKLNKKSFEENDPVSLYLGILLYNEFKFKPAKEFLEKAANCGFEGDAYSYLSMCYYDTGKIEQALSCAEKALEINPLNSDYKTRYEEILAYKNKKRFLFLFKIRKRAKIFWKRTLSIRHHELGKLQELNISIGDSYDNR